MDQIPGVSIAISRKNYFRFFRGVAVFLSPVFLSSPAFEPEAVSDFVLSSGVGASVFLESVFLDGW